MVASKGNNQSWAQLFCALYKYTQKPPCALQFAFWKVL